MCLFRHALAFHATIMWRQHSRTSIIDYCPHLQMAGYLIRGLTSRQHLELIPKQATSGLVAKRLFERQQELRRLQAQYMHDNALVIRKPPDAMASKQHGHSKAAWTETHLALAGEHESPSGSLGGKAWLRATQEQEVHVWKPWKRKDR